MPARRPPVVIVADCLDILPTMAKPYDVIVTSPPYDAGKSYEGKRDLCAYKEFARSWMAMIPRLLKGQGSLWLNVGYTKIGTNETLPLTYLYHEVKPPELKLVQEIVWHFEGRLAYTRRFSSRTERWMWFSLDPEHAYFDLDSIRDPAANRTKDKRNSPLGRNPTDYWYFDRVVGGRGRCPEKTKHPCQFPETMISRILMACCPAGGTVLDPFAGSVTVGRVASRLGLKATLIERHAEFVADLDQDRLIVGND